MREAVAAFFVLCSFVNFVLGSYSNIVQIRGNCARSCSSDAVINRGKSSFHLCILKCIDSKTKLTKKLEGKATAEEVMTSNQLFIGDITFDQLHRIMPNATQQQIYTSHSQINVAMNKFSIKTCTRKSAFLAQVAAETKQLNTFEKKCNEEDYEGDVYIGNVFPGDGAKFKPRGAFAIIGRTSYLLASREIGKDDILANPSVVSTPNYAFLIAGWYWNNIQSLHFWADENTPSSFDQISKFFNTPPSEYEERRNFWYRAKQVLGCEQ